MRISAIICAALFLCWSARSQDRTSKPAQPDQFEIGRHTFFDFGPPFDFYEIFLVRPSTDGSSVERITLTPAGNECVSPATIDAASASIPESVAALLSATNPCAIPEKVLRRELKRCKKCSVFSGANVVMQVQCGAETRLIRTDILDKDWFDASPHTPEHTSWTMQLLAHLDQAAGPGVMDKPAFPFSGNGEPEVSLDSPTLKKVGAGEYDALFKGAPNKPSDLYRAAQNPPPPPTVRLINSSVSLPTGTIVPPVYPPLTRITHVEGRVSFKIEIDSNGRATNLIFDSGHPLLRPSVEHAVGSWRFPKEFSDQQVQLTIEFALNCSQPK